MPDFWRRFLRNSTASCSIASIRRSHLLGWPAERIRPPLEGINGGKILRWPNGQIRHDPDRSAVAVQESDGQDRPSTSGWLGTKRWTSSKSRLSPLAISRRKRATSICGHRTHCFPQAIAAMESWGFKYKTNLVWVKVTKGVRSTGVVWDFITATSRKCSCSASRDIFGPRLQRGLKKISLHHKRRSIHVSPHSWRDN